MNEEEKERGLVTPEIINPKGGVRRNSTGKVVSRVSLSLSNTEGKILPHYLRASTSSCHDFCKYGRKHAFESEGNHLTFSKFSSNIAAPEEKNWVKISNLGERRKKSVVKLKASLHPKIELSGRPKTTEKKALSPSKTTKSARVSKTIKQNSPSLVKKIGSSEEPEIVKSIIPSPSEKIESSDELDTIKQNTAPVEKIELYEDSEIIMQKTPPLLKKIKSSEYPKTTKQKRHPVKKIQLFEEPETVDPRTLSVKKPAASAKSKLKQKAPSPVKSAITSVKPTFTKQTTPSPAKRFDASAKPAFSGKPKTAAVKSVSPLNPSTGITGRINSESKLVKSVALSKIGEKKVLKPPAAASLSPQRPVNSVSNLKLRKYNCTHSASPVKNLSKVGKSEVENDRIKEKTLYVIETEPEKNANSESVQLKSSIYHSSPSSRSSSSSSSSTSSSLPLSSSPYVSDHEEEEEEEEEEHEDSQSTFSLASDSVSECQGAESNQVELSEGEEDKKSRRGAVMVHSEDKDPTPHKLKFRRGKVVNPQSENNDPRRLRFRQGKRVGENQNGKEVGRRSFRRRRELVGGDSNHPDPEVQTVVLRHQDTQGKKDTQGLFNHVIEETASKLVETRKSKVKALVGAFETVISLQESKPAA